MPHHFKAANKVMPLDKIKRKILKNMIKSYMNKIYIFRRIINRWMNSINLIFNHQKISIY